MGGTSVSASASPMARETGACVGRRSAMALGLAGLTAMPMASHASYALYQSSETTMAERKASGDWQRSIGSDTATLQEIQADILRKRPQNALKAQKPPQYCAGQTSAVSPFLENRCQVIGVSKADQSNAMVDGFGNMNVGVYNSLSAEDRRKAEM